MLQGVLRLLATAEHVPAEGEQAAVVAVVDDLERGVVARAHARDEAIVAHAQQPPPARRLRRTDVDRGGGHRRKYAPPGQRNVKGMRGRCPGPPGTAWGATGRGPGTALRRLLGLWRRGAMHPCKDHGKARSPELLHVSCEFRTKTRPRRQLPRACSCPGRCPPNAGLIRDRTAQPSCGCPHGEERHARRQGWSWFVPEPDAPIIGAAHRRGDGPPERGIASARRWTDGRAAPTASIRRLPVYELA